MSLSEALQKARITTEEADRFVKQFQDPNFRKLFEEYANEISDPKSKAEHDAYLAQIESDGQAEAIYGKGVELIVPEPGLVVKTKDTTGAVRVYINICTSIKVDQCSEKRSMDPLRPGVHLTLPTALHSRHPKVGRAADGATVHVWDLALHPAALQQGASRQGLLDTIITIAIERVEVVSGMRLLRRYRLPKSRYKTLPGHEKPSVMSMQTGDGAQVIDGRIRPQAEAQGTLQVTSVDTSNSADGSKCTLADHAHQPHQKSSRSNFTFPSSHKEADMRQQQAPLAATPGPADNTHKCGAVTPRWDVVERGSADLGQAWRDRRLASVATAPQALVVRVQLPGIMSAAAVQLDVNRDSLQLQVPGKYLLNLQLKRLVKDQEGTAKYDKVKQLLTITLPVLQPEGVPQTHFPQQQQLLGATVTVAAAQNDVLQKMELTEQQHQEMQQEQQQLQGSSSHSPTSAVPSKKVDQGRTEHQSAVAETDAASVVFATASAQNSIEASKTANQRRWEHLHRQLDSEQQQRHHDQQLISRQLQCQRQKVEASEVLAKSLTTEQRCTSMLKPRLQGKQVTASMLD